MTNKRRAESEEPTPRKRHRSEEVATHISALPSDALLRIFAHLTGPALARAEAVCRRWRAEICNARNGIELWRGICMRHGIGAKVVSAVDRVRLARWTEAAGKEGGGEAAARRLAQTWRRLYVKYRHNICQHCLVYGRRFGYPLYGRVRLCRKCRFLEPHAALTTTQARLFFRFNDQQRGNMTRASCHGGWLYRLGEVHHWAADKYGQTWADAMLERARSALGIGRMVGNPPLKDV